MATVPNDLLNESVSHGTLREIDLYQSFIRVLERIDQEDADEFKHTWDDVIRSLESGEENAEIADMINELFTVLDEYAPEGYHFGSIEGDGSDFGFWGES